MAEPGQGLLKPDPKKECHVVIGLLPDKKNIQVDRETFWVSKSGKEEAEWFCSRKANEPEHEHGKNSPCFTVKFDKDATPFHNSVFTSNQQGYASSGPVRDEVKDDENTIYHYHVHMDGKEPLDPGGGVKP